MGLDLIKPCLYVVGTPIGNLGDMTPRAIEALKLVDCVAAEDTRRTRKLFSKFNIHSKIIAYHDHNKTKCAGAIIRMLKKGDNAALVTDSGTPNISDPGFHIIREACAENIEVRPIPGVSALTAALSVSHVPVDRFIFEGFLPRTRGKRMKRLAQLATQGLTAVFFEAPHRLEAFLDDLTEAFNDREAIIAGELTKMHEKFYRGRLSGARKHLKDVPPQGEYVVIVEGGKKREEREIPEENLIEEANMLIQNYRLNIKEACGLIAKRYGLRTGDVYRIYVKQ